jgi:hypothetical protein
MKNIFQQNYQKIREQYGSIIDALQITGEELGIKFILIGAQSRNVWSSHLKMNNIDIEITSAHKLGNEMSEIIHHNNLIRKK